MSDDSVFDRQLSLIRKLTEKIEMGFVRAVEQKAVAPVVLVLNLRDPRGRSMAEQFGQVERITDMIADSADRVEDPTVVAGIPLQVARSVIGDLVPDLEELVDSLSDGDGYIVVVVAYGGALARAMPPLPA